MPERHPLHIIARELETLHGLAANVQDHMAKANQAQAEANAMLSQILKRLDENAQDHEYTAKRVSKLERRLATAPPSSHS